MNDEYIKNVKNDRFAQLLGIEIVEAYPGYALVELAIGEKHKNGIDIVQGGVIFTLADYAFAVACNADGSTTVGINASISYFNAPQGAYIRAEAKEESKQKKICGYKVAIKDEDGTLIASFSGLGYRKKTQETEPVSMI
ncbi:thioesterase superfamily protein [Chlorobium limicola DSM 245]|uniref:Thioesterase superfamily protein n=1 Tax=Chlorobium limicola (strain DSM 245 / NBRC 103803 / 6330) TaxID=290315 RepID=B3EHB0_CHLL2|nr:PaaI family thioesterase [Chlorobium limicola]ACD91272.1 thioesterase superfamily protein [Chlorobium limicola DSM 245]